MPDERPGQAWEASGRPWLPLARNLLAIGCREWPALAGCRVRSGLGNESTRTCGKIGTISRMRPSGERISLASSPT